MKSIEERAEASVTFKKVGGDLADNDVFIHNIHAEGKRVGYIQGAKEQKELDDKLAFEEREQAFKAGYNTAIRYACEWLNGNLGYYNRNEVHIGKSYEQCVIEDFRKAMEEV